jgi:hypothetical protein
MKSKGGEMITKEIIELLIAAAGIIVIILLFYNLISPSDSKIIQSSEAFFDLFVDQISVVDGGGVGEFSIWQETENAELFFIYFGNVNGNQNRLTFKGQFFLDEPFEPTVKYQYNHKNVYCVCSLENEIPGCYHCANLANLASLDGTTGSSWSLEYPEKIKMKFENGFYKFTRIF